MSNPIKGLVAVIADYGKGKTTFALECGYHPKDITFINDDVKSTGFESDFGQYVDLVAETSELKALEFHNHCLNMIRDLPKSKVIIWDTWTQIQTTFPTFVKANPDKFRAANEYSSMGKIKSGEMYQDAYRYEGRIINHLKSKCDLLILTFHLKQMYIDNKAIPNRFKPGHDKAIEKYADMRIWLVANPTNQIPSGLVLKNISKRQITKDGIRTSQVLPLRLPLANWSNILDYYENPIANRMPNSDESPNEFEFSLISGTLTDEDKRLYQSALNAPPDEEMTDGAIKDFLERLSPAKKLEYVTGRASELGYTGDSTIPAVMAWINTL